MTELMEQARIWASSNAFASYTVGFAIVVLLCVISYWVAKRVLLGVLRYVAERTTST